MAEALYHSVEFTPHGGFTEGIEGPACDHAGNIYVVNYAHQGSIGKVTPAGVCSVFVELPNGSIGNGIRFDRASNMLIADYINHNVLRVDMQTRAISVYAHEPQANQPNDMLLMIVGDTSVICGIQAVSVLFNLLSQLDRNFHFLCVRVALHALLI